MSKKEETKGFCMFYDWVKDLSYLPGEDAWSLVVALADYYTDGVEPMETVEPHLKPIASIMFHQIQRQEAAVAKKVEAGRAGGLKKAATREAEGSTDVADDSTEVADDSTEVAEVSTQLANVATETETETDTETETETKTQTHTDTYLSSSPMRVRESEKDRFEKFWEAYPRKVGKANARKAFRAIEPDDDVFSDMLASIAEWRESEQWQNPRYIPYPASWLEREGWEDELCEPSPYMPSPPVPLTPSPKKADGLPDKKIDYVESYRDVYGDALDIF